MSVLAGQDQLMLIGGKLTPPRSQKQYPNINPATEQVIGYAPDAGLEDMSDAVAAARRAFDDTDWSTNHAFRRHCLEQLSTAIAGSLDELGRIDVAELGVPVSSLPMTQGFFVPSMAQTAQRADTYGYEQPLSGVGFLRREAVGVVGAVFTWNCGFMLWTTKVFPALAAGNTVVVRPAPETPWGSTFMARLIAEHTDIPAGVVNVVTSSDPGVAIALTEDPRVDMISFTGSTKVGQAIMSQAAGTVKKVLLELGGKNPNIILDDADLEAAISMSTGLCCAVAGQACGLFSRVLLPRSRYEEGVQLGAALVRGVVPGDPADPATRQGPQVSAAQRDRILKLIETAESEGASVVTGGGRTDAPKGYYVQPTILADVDPDSTIAQEEVFGPVLAMIAYDDDEDAVRIANNSIYGLFSVVSSADVERATKLARRIRTGSVMVNGAPLFGSAPFGGYKQSGLGREIGIWGFEEYLETKAIGISHDAVWRPS